MHYKIRSQKSWPPRLLKPNERQSSSLGLPPLSDPSSGIYSSILLRGALFDLILLRIDTLLLATTATEKLRQRVRHSIYKPKPRTYYLEIITGHYICDLCLYIYMCVCVHAYLHTYIHTLHIYTSTHLHISIHTYIHTYIHPSIHPSIHPCMHACMHACMRAYTRTYIHTHTPDRKVLRILKCESAPHSW